MELTVDRITKTDQSTIGNFLVDGVFEAYCLEPTDRGLTSDMSLEEVQGIKVAAQTAIPTGRYQVIKYFSPDHNEDVPCLVGVTDFECVEIHVGNFPRDTKACILLGTDKGPDEVLNSRAAVNVFYPKFFAAVAAGDEVWITVEDVILA